ncbi:protein of unknown function DUF305 [Methylocella silvestris BL2]|uniref:DUF305 domain-containing protein n=1 Tax=Methylocella silvestris (strain DSM 15510 / CIP 108128 / LMG 27833 / NCIMB 13906 / BL2) TaxID=395965 RepID=B8EL79_METSB|nr:DUF305 domain-containing protein [Methylocella silvestris]ACK49074.1 protein of unknown function DUF305 [Methylocella silvestris BL2]
MPPRALPLLCLALLLGGAPAGVLAAEEAGGVTTHDHGGMKMDAPATGAGKDSADAGYMRAMSNMDKTMSAPMTGDADVDFVIMMLPHHQGAVDMAKVALDHAKDPFVRKLAGDVVQSQEAEIAAMKQWLAAHQTKGKVH